MKAPRPQRRSVMVAQGFEVSETLSIKLVGLVGGNSGQLTLR